MKCAVWDQLKVSRLSAFQHIQSCWAVYILHFMSNFRYYILWIKKNLNCIGWIYSKSYLLQYAFIIPELILSIKMIFLYVIGCLRRTHGYFTCTTAPIMVGAYRAVHEGDPRPSADLCWTLESILANFDEGWKSNYVNILATCCR